MSFSLGWHDPASMLIQAGMQVNVDIIGVVTQAGPLGSVKRKVDASELQRRDVTITDQR